MANVSAAANTFNLPNYVGELFLVGGNQTPFLTMIGGLSNGGRAVAGWEYPVSVEEALNTAAQPDITETDARSIEYIAKYAMDHSMYGGGIIQAMTGSVREAKRVLAEQRGAANGRAK